MNSKMKSVRIMEAGMNKNIAFDIPRKTPNKIKNRCSIFAFAILKSGKLRNNNPATSPMASLLIVPKACNAMGLRRIGMDIRLV
jgi:hypothetical protein